MKPLVPGLDLWGISDGCCSHLHTLSVHAPSARTCQHAQAECDTVEFSQLEPRQTHHPQTVMEPVTLACSPEDKSAFLPGEALLQESFWPPGG